MDIDYQLWHEFDDCIVARVINYVLKELGWYLDAYLLRKCVRSQWQSELCDIILIIYFLGKLKTKL